MFMYGKINLFLIMDRKLLTSLFYFGCSQLYSSMQCGRNLTRCTIHGSAV